MMLCRRAGVRRSESALVKASRRRCHHIVATASRMSPRHACSAVTYVGQTSAVAPGINKKASRQRPRSAAIRAFAIPPSYGAPHTTHVTEGRTQIFSVHCQCCVAARCYDVGCCHIVSRRLPRNVAQNGVYAISDTRYTVGLSFCSFTASTVPRTIPLSAGARYNAVSIRRCCCAYGASCSPAHTLRNESSGRRNGYAAACIDIGRRRDMSFTYATATMVVDGEGIYRGYTPGRHMLLILVVTLARTAPVQPVFTNATPVKQVNGAHMFMPRVMALPLFVIVHAGNGACGLRLMPRAATILLFIIHHAPRHARHIRADGGRTVYVAAPRRRYALRPSWLVLFIEMPRTRRTTMLVLLPGLALLTTTGVAQRRG